LFLACQQPNSGVNLRECEDQSWCEVNEMTELVSGKSAAQFGGRIFVSARIRAGSVPVFVTRPLQIYQTGIASTLCLACSALLMVNPVGPVPSECYVRKDLSTQHRAVATYGPPSPRSSSARRL
jgi:hypothetical protein